MAQVVYARRTRHDFDRIVDHLAADDRASALTAVERIATAVEILENHPLIGRPAEEGLRELVISRGKSGYVALHDYDEIEDLVVVLAIRHQREAGYPPP